MKLCKILLFLLSSNAAYPFDTSNSLFKELGESQTTVDFLYNLAWDNHDKGFYDSALYYADIQEKLARKINYNLGLINSHYIKGVAYNKNNFFDLSAKELYEGLSLIKENSDSVMMRKKALMLQCLGVSYERAKSLDYALNYYQEALALFKTLGLISDKAILLYNIGVIYEIKNELSSSLNYYERSLALNQSIKNNYQMAIVNNSIGNIHNKLGNYSKAKDHYLIALNISREFSDLDKERAFYISNLGENAFKQDKFDTAKIYYNQALSLSQKLNDTEKIKWLNNNLGDVYLKEKNFEKAIAFYNKSIELGRTENIDEELKRSYQNIAKAYDALGNYQLASQFKDKYMGQAELLAQTRDKLQEQNAQYRMKEVEWQMERLAKNEQIQFYQTSVFWFRVSISLILLVLVMISYFTYKYYRKIALARRLLNY